MLQEKYRIWQNTSTADFEQWNGNKGSNPDVTD